MPRSDLSTSAGASNWGAIAVELVAVVGYSFIAVVAIGFGLVDGPLRVLLAAPVLGFLPGYALVSTLLPGDDGEDGPTLTAARLRRPGVSWFERCSLAVAASLALLPFIAMGLSAGSLPMSLEMFLLSLSVVIGLGMVGGVSRRASLPVAQRYAIPIDRWIWEAEDGVEGVDDTLEAVLNVALVVVVVLALSGLAYGLVAPDRGESYSEVALLTEQGDSLVAGGYPETVRVGESAALTLAVENEDGATQRYSVIVQLERVRTTEESVTILQQEELTRFSMTVDDRSTANRSFSAEPTMLGEDLRLDVLVFEGAAPTNPTPAQADHQLYLWLDVREPGTNSSAVGPVGWA